jgi:uncharacterized glyoxalase superfamily protein PhnB
VSGLTVHIVARGADRAAAWYAEALGAEERGRIAVPDGRFMQIELWFGDAQVMLSDEFVELGVVSPETLEGSPVVLHLRVDDVDAVWNRAVEAGRSSASRSRTRSGVSATASSRIRLDTAGASRNTCETSHAKRSRRRSRRCSAEARRPERCSGHDLVSDVTLS